MKLEKYEEQTEYRYTFEECVRYGEYVNRFDYDFNNQILSYIIYDFQDNLFEFTMINGIVINVTTY